MPLSWVNAFKRALIYFLWLIVWGIIGILMIAIGYAVAMNPLIKLITDMLNNKPATYAPELITGIVVAVVGYLIVMIGSTATLIRLVYQLSYEATQEVLKGKPPATPAVSTTPAAEAKPTPPTAAQPTPAPAAVQPPQPTIPWQPAAPAPLPTHQKYCAFCGKAIAISARFCPFCQRAQP